MINISTKHPSENIEIIDFYYVPYQADANKNDSYDNLCDRLIDFMELNKGWFLVSFFCMNRNCITSRFMKET